MYPLLPVVFLMTVPVVEVSHVCCPRSVAPRVCEHPWYMDGRCIVVFRVTFQVYRERNGTEEHVPHGQIAVAGTPRRGPEACGRDGSSSRRT